jgi:hypothetical protein
MSLTLTLNGDRALYKPKEKLSGVAGWQLDRDVRAVEVRLIWFTQGKGTQDVGVVDRRRWETPRMMGQEKFEFTLPDGPQSFSGRLISLTWAVELVIEKAKESQRVEFTLSPFDSEIVLGTPT